MKKQIAILGSTGSIGTQALEVISEHPNDFEVYCLTAGSNYKKLALQAKKFSPSSVVIADEEKYDELKDLLSDRPDIKVYAGMKAIEEIVEASPIDMVLAAMVGFSGLSPTIHAIKAGKKICLANKETLVVAGELICRLASENRSPIIPVDSEHSAIFQSLSGEGDNKIERIFLTASGGPFRNFSLEELEKATVKDALKHPTWQMGEKITIDSATMMNKGFEVIEAKWLFGVNPEKIEVLIHPQSILHSAVEFSDGSVKAQLGIPDMRLPIQYAFSYPDRLPLEGKRLDLFKQPLEFFKPDVKKFRCLSLAFKAISLGGNMPCILNAANEVVNKGFLENRCSFLKMAEIIEKTLEKVPFIAFPSYEELLKTNSEARLRASELLN